MENRVNKTLSNIFPKKLITQKLYFNNDYRKRLIYSSSKKYREMNI